MRSRLMLIFCCLLLSQAPPLNGDEPVADVVDLPAVLQDLDAGLNAWRERSQTVRDILAPTKVGFEKVDYRIGSLDALTESLNAPMDCGIVQPAQATDHEQVSGFAADSLNWTHAGYEAELVQPTGFDAQVVTADHQEVSHADHQIIVPAPAELDPELARTIHDPMQVFSPPLDPVLQEYLVAPDPEPKLPKTLWQEYTDWFKDGFISWTERLELGGSFLEGNTNQEAFNTAAKFSRDTTFTSTQINMGGNHAQSKQRTTANRWFADNTTDFKREGNWLYFVRSLHEYDQFTNLDYRGTFSFGSGYRFFNEDNKKLIVRYGPGVTQEVFHSPRVVRTSPDLFAELETKWLIGPRVVFEEKATMHPNITNFGMLRVLNTTSFLIPLDDQKRWNLKVGFRYEYNGKPNANREPNDFATNVNIVYSRK